MKITKLGVLREHLGALQGSRSGALVSLLREAMSSGLVPLSVPDALVDRFRFLCLLMSLSGLIG